MLKLTDRKKKKSVNKYGYWHHLIIRIDSHDFTYSSKSIPLQFVYRFVFVFSVFNNNLNVLTMFH